MAFPTTSILDNFNRTDEGPPLSANWESAPLGFGTGHEVISNQAAGDPSGTPSDTSSRWSAASYGPDVEAYISIPTRQDVADFDVVLSVKGVEDPSPNDLDAYEVNIQHDNGGEIHIRRSDDFVTTQLGAAIAQAYADGDSIGIEVIGDQIRAWHKTSAGSWTNVGTRTDATYQSQVGDIYLYSYDEVVRLDDFGGGTYSPTLFGAGITGGSLQSAITVSPFWSALCLGFYKFLRRRQRLMEK